ncbi:uncharacterized protein LODBEIA_P52310 [Lodderomyces beijingensis]|uniref:Uncharacterized protein n=1 Tax=Lodderomyces beijingensis TaxID=1775926 RepID=A0ABP0ZSC2_9ASCO
MPSINLPDLRFEQTFWRQLNSYAGHQSNGHSSPLSYSYPHGKVQGLTDAELDRLNQDMDKKEGQELSSVVPQPLSPITPGIVVYAILKDVILMPFLQGLFLTGFLISIRPVLNTVVKNGQQAGIWVSNLLGLNSLKAGARRRAF